MQVTQFQFRIPGDEDLSRLNDFFRKNQIVSVSRELIQLKDGAILVFIVETSDSNARNNHVPEAKKTAKIDYREILDQAQFEMFSKLRELRKQMAEAEGVPVYTIFNNAQLAEMIQCNVQSESDLRKIDGVGQSRISKFGNSFLKLIVEHALGRDAETANNEETLTEAPNS